MVSAGTKEKIRRAVGMYPDPRAALLPSLRFVQEEIGFLPDEAITYIAGELNVAESEVFGSASFYTMIQRRPGSRHLIQICHNLSCSLLGAETLIRHIGGRLGVREGEVTDDGRFSFVRVECIGGCDGAPAMLVNSDYYDNLTAEKIDDIMTRYQ